MTFGTEAKRPVAIAVTIALAWAGAAAEVARAAAWLPPLDVSAPQTSGGTACGFLTGQPGVASVDVAVNSRGDTVMSWTRKGAGNAQVVQASLRPAGGAFGPPQDLGTTAPCYFLALLGPTTDVAIDDTGNAIATWTTMRAGRGVVQAAVRASGGGFAPAIDLSDDSQSAGSDPRVAMSGPGHAVVVWSRSNGTNDVIQASSRAPGGSFGLPANLSNSAPVANQHAINPRVAVNSQGAAAVTWARSNGSNTIVQARVRPAGGSFAAVQDLSETGRDASVPDIAIDPTGRATAIWQRSDGTQMLVQSRFLTAAGAIGAAVNPVSAVGFNANGPSLSVDADNTVIAVWGACAVAGGDTCVIQSASRPSNGSFGAVQTISAPTNSNLSPKVAVDATGNAVAAWSQGLTKAQAAQRPRGGAFGGVIDLSDLAGGAGFVSLAVDGEGNAIAGWTFTRPTPDSRQVAQAAPLDAAPPTFTDVTVPATGVTGQPVPMSAGAFDRWSTSSITWSFGDGAAVAGPSVSHVYGGPGVFTVTATATDGAGNTASATRAIQVSNPAVVPAPSSPSTGTGPASPPRPSSVTSPVSFGWRVNGSRLTLTQLLVRNPPRGVVATLLCSGSRCPFKSVKASKVSKSRVDVLKALGKRRTFRAKQKLELRVAAPGLNTKVLRFSLTAGKVPTSAPFCIPVGTNKVQKSCT